MNIISIAVASIVDANTGNGINQKFVDKFASDYSAHERHAREIRANTFITLLGKIKSAVEVYIERAREAARQREYIRAISSMSEHLQKDIGLTQIDLDDLRLGRISLDQLSTRRQNNLNLQDAYSQRLIQSSGFGDTDTSEVELVNHDNYELKKCA